MNATITFNLPEEESDFALACNAGKLASALSNLDREARNMLKYGHKMETADDVLRWIRSEIVTPELRELIES